MTNNPNAIYTEGNLVLGVGEGGNHIVIDPVSGEVLGGILSKASYLREESASSFAEIFGQITDRYFQTYGDKSDALAISGSFLCLLLARVLNQNSSHRFCGGRPNLPSVLPPLLQFHIHQPEIGFVH